MSPPGRRRTLASLVLHEAPLPPRRAASVMVAVCRELERLEAAGTTVTDLDAERVELDADGSVQILPGGDPDGVAAGAGVGRLLFELSVGRPPLGSEDAFEPHLTRSMSPGTVSLLARSASGAPGQWPTLSDWSAALGAAAGGQAPPEPPAAIAARRRRRAGITVAAVLLVAVSVVVLVLAPRWWDDATREEGHGPTGRSQLVDRS